MTLFGLRYSDNKTLEGIVAIEPTLPNEWRRNKDSSWWERTEGPQRVSTPQVAALHRAEIRVPQEEWSSILGVARYVGREARVPPWVPGEGADRRGWIWLQHAV